MGSGAVPATPIPAASDDAIPGSFAVLSQSVPVQRYTDSSSNLRNLSVEEASEWIGARQRAVRAPSGGSLSRRFNRPMVAGVRAELLDRRGEQLRRALDARFAVHQRVLVLEADRPVEAVLCKRL